MSDIRSEVDMRERLDCRARYDANSFLRKRLVAEMLNRSNRLHDRAAFLMALMRQDYLELLEYCCAGNYRGVSFGRSLYADLFYGNWLFLNKKQLLERGISKAVFAYLKKCGIVEIETDETYTSNLEESFISYSLVNPNHFKHVEEILKRASAKMNSASNGEMTW